MTLASGTADADTRATQGLYVYGVVRAGALDSVSTEGVTGASVELIERDGLAALVSALPTRYLRVKRRDLHRHLQVIESAFAATTILPCPFGMVAHSREEVLEGLLSAARDDLLAGLEQLRGAVQMNVKAGYDEEELLREIVNADPEIARLREHTRHSGNAGYYDRLQLGELVADRVADRRERDAERMIRELAAVSVDFVVDESEEGGALKASFLVERKLLGRFDKTLESIAKRERPLLLFEAIGPLPPTAFAAAYANT